MEHFILFCVGIFKFSLQPGKALYFCTCRNLNRHIFLCLTKSGVEASLLFIWVRCLLKSAWAYLSLGKSQLRMKELNTVSLHNYFHKGFHLPLPYVQCLALGEKNPPLNYYVNHSSTSNIPCTDSLPSSLGGWVYSAFWICAKEGQNISVSTLRWWSSVKFMGGWKWTISPLVLNFS